MTLPRVLNVKQAAEVFGVKPFTIREWCRLGILDAHRPSGTKAWRIPREAVEALAQEKFGDNNE